MSGIATEDDDMTQDAAAMSAPSAGSTTVPFAPYYQDEAVTIYNADCRKVLPFLERFDLLLTDPPYGMNLNTDYSGMNGWSGKGKKHERIANDDKPFSPAFLLEFRARRNVIWGANFFADKLPPNGGWLVFNKRGDGKPSEVCFGDCELAWADWQQSVRMYSRMWHGVARWRSEPQLHPTQKPVSLMHWCIEQAGEVSSVLDPFMGCGPVLVAAKAAGKTAVGIEISEKYCEAAANRLRQGVLF